MIRLHHVIRPVGAATAALAIILLSTGSPRAHDIYSHVYANGRLCCGGDPVTGDCEPLTDEQVHEKQDHFVIESRRYGHPVVVAKDIIQWQRIPGEVPGTAGHWCGRPRGGGYPTVDAQDPDPGYHTFCAFLAPGAV